MGCQNSKGSPKQGNKAPDTKRNGGAEPNAPAPLDPRLPLKARQLFLLKKSWKGVKRNMAATGVELFIGLFRKNEELFDLFTGFRGIKVTDDLRGSEVVEAHGLLVMGVLDECIEKLENVDHVEAVCARVACAHGKFAGFNPSLFWNMEDPFLAALKIILSDRYTEQMDVIYQLTIKFIISCLTKACNHS